MAVYSTVKAHYLEDGPFSFSEPPPNRHRKSRRLLNDILSEEGGLDEDVPVVEVRDGESEKLKKSVRRRQKAETDIGSHTLNMPLMEDNGGGSVFSSIKRKGLALMPKSSSRIALAADADAVPVGLGDSIVTSLFDGVRKSSSTSNLQDQNSIKKSINHNIVVAFIHGYCLIVNF
ncbi:hypothetical protein IFM89_003245 [Coptis chinensis]|uniref:Uncharacterized protein n=1 Tax=Coptis chinensis TaxID=261450 RepID=A0A835IB96_9MAGN|nr:hypothetical protein IFM89_003245 [Coptis chinensis]